MQINELMNSVDVDRLLGLADQFLDDWAEDAVQNGKRDPDYEERMAEWTALRPILLASPKFLRGLEEIIGSCDTSSAPVAKRCEAIARRAIDALPQDIAGRFSQAWSAAHAIAEDNMSVDTRPSRARAADEAQADDRDAASEESEEQNEESQVIEEADANENESSSE